MKFYLDPFFYLSLIGGFCVGYLIGAIIEINSTVKDIKAILDKPPEIQCYKKTINEGHTMLHRIKCPKGE